MFVSQIPNLALILKAYRTGGRSNEAVVVRENHRRARRFRAGP
jgi:hypothetical protein